MKDVTHFVFIPRDYKDTYRAVQKELQIMEDRLKELPEVDEVFDTEFDIDDSCVIVLSDKPLSRDADYLNSIWEVAVGIECGDEYPIETFGGLVETNNGIVTIHDMDKFNDLLEIYEGTSV